MPTAKNSAPPNILEAAKGRWRRGALLGALSGLAAGLLFIQLILWDWPRSGVWGWARSTSWAENYYSSWLFLFAPFIMGIVASMVARLAGQDSDGMSFWATGIAYCSGNLLMLLFAFEGAICLLMAFPIGFGSACLGAHIVNLLSPGGGRALASVIILLPLAMLDARNSPAETRRAENTSLVIDAPPDKVWPFLFNLPSVPAPKDLLMRNGIAHPLATISTGQRAGDSRTCLLSTGPMPERITEIVPDRLLRFRVLGTPACMKELNPFGEVKARHLVGYYTCEQGEFRLDPLPGGKTLLEGSSTYSFRIYPAAYWSLWTDHIVEQVHQEVMQEVKRRAEAANNL